MSSLTKKQRDMLIGWDPSQVRDLVTTDRTMQSLVKQGLLEVLIGEELPCDQVRLTVEGQSKRTGILRYQGRQQPVPSPVGKMDGDLELGEERLDEEEKLRREEEEDLTRPIPLEQEPDHLARWEQEHCCFCCTPSLTWTRLPDRKPGAQVACCRSCAMTHTPDEVPSKDVWCDAEHLEHPRMVDSRTPLSPEARQKAESFREWRKGLKQ